MTDAVLEFQIKSGQAKQAASDLEKMTAASNAAEIAQQKLASASAGANGALARIASGVDQANAALAQLVKLMETNSVAATKMDTAKQSVAKTSVQEARASEAVVVSLKQEAATNDQVTASINRQNEAIAMRARARAAAGLDAFGRTQAEAAAQAASAMERLAQADPSKLAPWARAALAERNTAQSAAPIPVSVNAQAELTKAQTLTTVASEGARATGMLTAGLTAAFVPASLLQFAIFSLSGAAIEWAREMVTGASATEKALERHKKLIDEIAASFPKAAEAAKAYEAEASKLPQSVALAKTQKQAEEDQKVFTAAWDQALAKIKSFSVEIDALGQKTSVPGYEQFAALADQMEKGEINAAKLQDQIGKISLDKSLPKDVRETAYAFLELAKAAADAEARVGGINAAVARQDVRGGRPNDGEGAAMTAYILRNRSALFQLNRERDVALGRIGARSPQDLADAARAREELRPVDGNEDPQVRKFREDTAAATAYAQALHQITAAQEQRIRSLNQTMAGQQLDLTLVGKTAGEAARARFEFEHLAQVREQAVQQGITKEDEFQKIFGREIDLIKKAADETGRYADALARANVAKDLVFEHDQLRRTTEGAAIAAMQRSAGLPIDLNSPEALAMRANLDFSQAKDIAKNFLTTFENTLVSSGGDVGKAMGSAILSALMNSMTRQWEKIFDQLSIAFASAITGQKGGGGAGLGTAVIGSMFGGANDNYALGAVTRAALPNVGMDAYRNAIQAVESVGSGGYSALGPIIPKTGDRAYGAYQVMGANIPSWTQSALGTSMTPSQFLASPTAQDAVFDHQFGKYLSKYGSASDAASSWFTGGPLKSGANSRDILGTSGSAYVDKFNAALGDASKGLNSFGGGLGKMGEALSKFPSAPAMSGGGGGGGLLGSLFGGLSSAFSGTAAFSWLSANPGGYIGLYADGTENAPEGWAWVGERGPELRKIRAGDVIRSNQRSMEMVANQNGRSQAAPSPKFDIHIYGGSGDDHIRKLVEEGSRTALAEYQSSQVRGGFGNTQQKFASFKG